MQKACTAHRRCPRRNDATDSFWGQNNQNVHQSRRCERLEMRVEAPPHPPTPEILFFYLFTYFCADMRRAMSHFVFLQKESHCLRHKNKKYLCMKNTVDIKGFYNNYYNDYPGKDHHIQVLVPFRQLLKICCRLTFDKRKKKHISCAFHLIMCTTVGHKGEKWKKRQCELKVQYCEESFYWDLRKGRSFPASYRKCRGPIISKCDAVRRLQVLSSLATPCQCCSMKNGTVEKPPKHPALLPNRMEKKKRPQSWVAQGSRFNFYLSIHF